MTCPKRAYGQKAATKEAKRLRAESGEPFRAYACPDCGRWHLSTQPRDGEPVKVVEGSRASLRRGRRTEGMSLEQIREMAERMKEGR